VVLFWKKSWIKTMILYLGSLQLIENSVDQFHKARYDQNKASPGKCENFKAVCSTISL
jgi:hypothetical protein